MMRVLLSILLLSSWIAGADVNVWPMPRGPSSIGTVVGVVTSSFEVLCTGAGCPSLSALSWYQARIRASAATAVQDRRSPTLEISKVTLSVSSLGTASPSMNESYKLFCSVSEGSCEIGAPEAVGSLRGLETLAHLAHSATLPLPVEISDSPRFPYRGLLIDSARHFLNTRTVKRILDAMSMMKLNVLHWHLTDDTAFPVQSRVFPQLSVKGAYHPLAVYKHSDLAEIVAYANERGIRVVPEFDMPGHSSWGKGMPNLTIAACGGTLDPTLDATYEFLTSFLGEMGTVFKDPYLALGGDEVSFDCAATVKKEWLEAHNLSAPELLPYFWRRMTRDVLPKLHKTLYVWGTNTLSNLDPAIVPQGSVFNLYTDLSSTLNITAIRGVPAILSAPYYLDQTQSYRMGPGKSSHLASSTPACGTAIGHINDLWKCFYSASPTDGVDAVLAQNVSLVVGGEACIWGEGTSSWSIETQTLTVASAVAERLWSGQKVEASAEARLASHVCMMNMFGLHAAPIGPGFCIADVQGSPRQSWESGDIVGMWV